MFGWKKKVKREKDMRKRMEKQKKVRNFLVLFGTRKKEKKEKRKKQYYYLQDKNTLN